MAFGLAACGAENKPAEANAESTPSVEESVGEPTEESSEETPAEEQPAEDEESSVPDASGKIEFENFIESEGVGTEGSNDDDTLSLAGLNQSGYTAYEINLGDGGYEQIAIRYSSGTEGGKVEIHYMAPDGDLLGEIELPGTGDWATYTTVTADLPKLETFARDKVLYFVYSGDDYLFNLNWFQLYQVTDAGLQTEAENCFDLNGVGVEGCSDATGGESLGGIQNDFWTAYKLDFGEEGGFEQISFRASSAMEDGGDVEIHLGSPDGELLGTCKIESTGDWSNWVTSTYEIPDMAKVTGKQDIYMVYRNGGDWLFNINWFRFYKKALDVSERVEAENFIEATVGAEDCAADGTMNIGGVTPGTYAAYLMNFGDGGYNKLKVRASSPMTGGDIIFHSGSLEGEVVATVTIGGSDVYGSDWANYGDWDFEVPELAALTGTQVLYLEFNNPPGGSSHCFNINWFEFTK